MKTFSDVLPGGVELEMVEMPGGTFLAGAPEGHGFRFDMPQYEATVQPFALGKYPITQLQWKAVVNSLQAYPILNPDSAYASPSQIYSELNPDPSCFKGDTHPVEQVSLFQIVRFCYLLSRLTGRSYRLPTELEWEYACRAGTTTRFYFSDDSYQLTDYAWYYHNSNQQTHPVGQKKPNSFGLYDMHGNVCELCEISWSIRDPWPGRAKVVARGGHFEVRPGGCTSYYRWPVYEDNDIETMKRGLKLFGFRVACSAA